MDSLTAQNVAVLESRDADFEKLAADFNLQVEELRRELAATKNNALEQNTNAQEALNVDDTQVAELK